MWLNSSERTNAGLENIHYFFSTERQNENSNESPVENILVGDSVDVVAPATIFQGPLLIMRVSQKESLVTSSGYRRYCER